jgi:hypothetical protein
MLFAAHWLAMSLVATPSNNIGYVVTLLSTENLQLVALLALEN